MQATWGAVQLRSIVAPAACDASVILIDRYGRGLDDVPSYAYIPLRCRVDVDRLYTMVTNSDAFRVV